jgi:hypothetical protein
MTKRDWRITALLDDNKALRESHDQLLATAKEILPEMGWHGSGPEDRDKYYCEHCKAAAQLTDEDIKHLPRCPVLRLRAAIALAEKVGQP